MYVYEQCLCLVPTEIIRGLQTLELDLEMAVCLESNTDALQERKVLLPKTHSRLYI